MLETYSFVMNVALEAAFKFSDVNDIFSWTLSLTAQSLTTRMTAGFGWRLLGRWYVAGG